MAAKEFNIMQMLNDESKSQGQKRSKLDYLLLEQNKDNHYSTDGIEELADSIEDVGLQQELVVKKSGDKYIIVVGHRRYLAIVELVENRKNKDYKKVPCVIIEEDEDETITGLKLHLTNTTARVMTEHDKMVAIREIEQLIKDAKSKGIKIKGRVRKLVADTVGLSETQVQRYKAIDESATEETKESLRKGEITMTAAEATIKPKKSEAAEEFDVEELNNNIENLSDDNDAHRLDDEEIVESTASLKEDNLRVAMRGLFDSAKALNSEELMEIIKEFSDKIIDWIMDNK